jgi:hypothetical protein
MIVLISFLSAPETIVVLMGVALVAVGLATLGTWVLRVKGRPRPTWLSIGGRVALVAALVVGTARTIPDLARALGMA